MAAKKEKQKHSTVSTVKKRIAEQQAQWLEEFKNIWTIAGTCQKMGIDRGTFYVWAKGYPEFLAKKKEIEKDQIEYVESKLYQAIRDNNMTAIIFYLKNMARAKWGAEEKRRFEGEIAVLKLKDGQRKQIRKLIERGTV